MTTWQSDIIFYVDAGARRDWVVGRVADELDIQKEEVNRCIDVLIQSGVLAYDVAADWLVVRDFMPRTAAKIDEKDR